MTHALCAKPQPYVQSAFCPWVREGNTFLENSVVLPFMNGMCLDIGPGNNRFSDTIIAVDVNSNADCELVLDCFAPMPFKTGAFDAIVSSHCLEDAPPDIIQAVFNEWMRLVKVGGYLCLLVPDMESGRYPDVDDKWTEFDRLVQLGDRNAGDCKGNSAHQITMGYLQLNKLVHDYPGKCEVVQANTLPKDQMTLDMVIRKDA